MYVGTNGFVFELDPRTGAVEHSLQVTDPVGIGDYATAVTADAGHVYAGVHGYVYGIDNTDWSKSLWTTAVGGTGAYKQVAVAIAGGRLFAASDGYVYELNPGNGGTIHSLLLTSRFATGDFTTSLATDGTTLYVGVHGYVYGVNLGDWSGSRWSAGLGNTGYHPANVVWTGSRLYAGCNGYVYEIDRTNGNPAHSLLVTGSVGVGDYTTRVASDGRSLFAGVHGYVYGVSLADWSKTAWNVPVGVTATYPLADVLELNGRLFAGAAGYAYEIDSASGALLRTLPLASALGVGTYDTQLATDGHNVFYGAHGYSYRVLTLYPQGIGPIGFVAAAPSPSGDVQVVALDRQDGMFHTIRKPDGTWPYAWGNVIKATSAPFASAQLVATTMFTNAQLSVLALDDAGTLWHIMRNSDGSWTAPWLSVQAAMQAAGHPPISAVTYVAAIADAKNNMHVLVLDSDRTLWHTIRQAAGYWPYPWGNVQSVIRAQGNPTIGPIALVAGAINPNGDLQVVVLDEAARLWHTIRLANETWPYPWGDVDAAIGGRAAGQLRYVAVVTDPSGNLSLLATDQQGTLWHTIRLVNGTWPSAWGNVNEAVVKDAKHVALDRSASTAGVINAAGDLHVLNVDEPAGLYCTTRTANGFWPDPWSDVQGAVVHRT